MLQRSDYFFLRCWFPSSFSLLCADLVSMDSVPYTVIQCSPHECSPRHCCEVRWGQKDIAHCLLLKHQPWLTPRVARYISPLLRPPVTAPCVWNKSQWIYCDSISGLSFNLATLCTTPQTHRPSPPFYTSLLCSSPCQECHPLSISKALFFTCPRYLQKADRSKYEKNRKVKRDTSSYAKYFLTLF